MACNAWRLCHASCHVCAQRISASRAARPCVGRQACSTIMSCRHSSNTVLAGSVHAAQYALEKRAKLLPRNVHDQLVFALARYWYLNPMLACVAMGIRALCWHSLVQPAAMLAGERTRLSCQSSQGELCAALVYDDASFTQAHAKVSSCCIVLYGSTAAEHAKCTTARQAAGLRADHIVGSWCTSDGLST